MSKLVHRFAAFVTGATLFLIFVGGMVTSTSSGLAVPDWPLSYGRLMPPMIGGIFYEHGHRMVAATVGFLTIILAFLISFKEERRWVRIMGWTALGLVIMQGLLGGLTVLFRLPKPISIAHACLGQTFFCTVLALSVWTSRFWRETPIVRQEHQKKIPLHRLSLAVFLATYVQLLLGALLRHTGHGLTFHISGALIVAALSIWTFVRIFKTAREIPQLLVPGLVLISLVILQISLGIGSYFILIHPFEVIPPPLWSQVTITFHVATGALVLGTSVVIALLSYRTRPSETAPLQRTLKDYWTLTKPGISFMAGITALAGFVLGSGEKVDLLRLLHTCLGTLLAAAGAGCLNMLMEKDIDARMRRTKTRPLPSGRLQPGEVLFLGIAFSMGSVLYLAWTVNLLTALLAGLTVSIYLYIYTPLKKISTACVAIGAIAGALPPVMGWTAATGRLGWEPLALFGILFLWQFPHFLSLAWLYKEDYSSGGLHMINPSDAETARSIFISSVSLIGVSLVPSLLHLTGVVYFTIAAGAGVWMTYLSYKFFLEHTAQNARRVFLFSLLYIPLLVVFMVAV